MSKEELLQQTKNSDSHKRREAAKMLSAFKDIDVIQTLIGLLTDKNTGVIDAAYHSLASINTKEVVEQLLNLIVDKEYKLESSAFDLLSKIGAPYLPIILEHLKNTEDHNSKKILLDIIGNLKIHSDNLTELEMTLSSLLHSDNPNIRLTASETIGKLNLVNCKDALIQRLSIEQEEWVQFVLKDTIDSIQKEK